MKVTYNWLKEFLNIKISPRVLAEKLTLAGLEVVSLEELQDDFVFEIEITSNRPDWLSILGVAREVAAITDKKIKKSLRPQISGRKVKSKNSKSIIKNLINVEDKNDCPFYTARIIRNVKVGPSPEWLKKRLELVGCRSVNNIVDVTNYILFELGQPLHAFDLDKLNSAKIRVRRAKSNETITTIDGVIRTLSPEILVIADAVKPLAIAGIMGGKETEVTFKTCNILLEAAVFNPMLVRRTKQKLGLQSESAYRFERGVDLEALSSAGLAAQELILKLASGEPSGFNSWGSFKVMHPRINLDIVYLNKLLGTVIPGSQIKQILNRLGLKVAIETKNIFSVTIPSFRQDLKLPVDLVEEVARIYGYDKIPQTLPAVSPSRGALDKKNMVCGIKNILSALGLDEAITYSLVDRQLLINSGINNTSGLIEILNPLSKEQEVLRPALFPSLIRVLAYNLNQQQEKVSIFEMANVFSGQRDTVRENFLLSIALCGEKTFFTKQGLARDEITMLHLKGILETLFNRLRIKDFSFSCQEDDKISIIINQKIIGFIQNLSSQILSVFDIKHRQVVLGQIDLEMLFSSINLEKKFLEISKYPAITRDISFVINEGFSVEGLLTAIREKGASLLDQVKIVDYYQGKQIPVGYNGLTVSCIYRLNSRTLTEEEIAPVHNDICSLLQERFGIKLRSS